MLTLGDDGVCGGGGSIPLYHRFGGDGDAEKAVAEFAGDKIIGRNRVRLDWAQDKHMQVSSSSDKRERYYDDDYRIGN